MTTIHITVTHWNKNITRITKYNSSKKIIIITRFFFFLAKQNSYASGPSLSSWHLLG